MLTLLLCLAFTGGPDPIPIQRPGPAPAPSTPTEDDPVAKAAAEEASTPDPEREREPAPALEFASEPAPEPEPERKSEPTAEPEEFARGVQPLVQARDPAPPAPLFQPGGAPPAGDYVRVRPPKLHGSGLIGVGVAAMGASVVMQAVWAGTCGDPFCDWAGIHQRVLIGSGLLFVSAGAYKRGQWNAYRDTLADAPMPAARLRAHKIAGWTLAAGGLIAFGTDFAFHSQCAIAQRGPNVNAISQDWWGGVDCKGWASATVMNLSGAAAATGLGLAFHATKYGRDRKFYRNARVAAAPSLGRNYLGLGLSGSF